MADDASREAKPTMAIDEAAPANVPVANAIPPALAAAITSASAASTPGPATGTVTPALSEMQPEQAEHSLRVSLADLCAKGAALYAHKSYEDAAEVYSRATEMQAEINGEMSPANAEILFLYGRALFKVGQSKSDVLGGKAPETKKEPAAKKLKNGSGTAQGASSSGPIAAAIAHDKAAQEPETEAQRITEEGVAIIAAETTAGKEEAATIEAKKPLFQFQGDENWDDSDDEEDAQAEDEEAEEEDDLAVAFEILDMARVLFNKRRSEGDQEDVEGKGKAKIEDDTPEVRHIKERLADTHDLLAEISLENERYPNAITDFEAALQFKQELFPKESEVIAEAHFKLSLALEFASVTTSEEDKPEGAAGESAKEQTQQVDQDLRDRAAVQLEAAIESTRLKLQNKEVDLATMHSPDENEATRKQIAEVKDIIADMEQRLVDLRKPPIDINAAMNGPAGALGGVLGATLGETAGEAQARIAEAKKTAKDLTGLVRKKTKADEPVSADTAAASSTNGSETKSNGKRKADDTEDASESDSKKARVEDVVEA